MTASVKVSRSVRLRLCAQTCGLLVQGCTATVPAGTVERCRHGRVWVADEVDGSVFWRPIDGVLEPVRLWRARRALRRATAGRS